MTLKGATFGYRGLGCSHQTANQSEPAELAQRDSQAFLEATGCPKGGEEQPAPGVWGMWRQQAKGWQFVPTPLLLGCLPPAPTLPRNQPESGIELKRASPCQGVLAVEIMEHRKAVEPGVAWLCPGCPTCFPKHATGVFTPSLSQAPFFTNLRAPGILTEMLGLISQ